MYWIQLKKNNTIRINIIKIFHADISVKSIYSI